MRKGARDKLKLQFYLSLCRSNLVSCERVRFTSVFVDRISFRAQGCAGQVRIVILPQSLSIESRFVRKGTAGQVEIAILPQFLTIEHRFVRKGCVSCRLVGTAPAPAFRREIEKKERAKGQEGKRARGEDVKM